MSILVSIAYRGMVESGQAHIEHTAAFSILVSCAFKYCPEITSQHVTYGGIHLCLYVTVIEQSSDKMKLLQLEYYVMPKMKCSIRNSYQCFRQSHDRLPLTK